MTLRLPATLVDRPRPSATAVTPDLPLRILLVDDDAEVRSTIARVLDELGHSVVQAERGQDVLDRLAVDPGIQLVVTDLGMPGWTGWALAREIKARHPSVPVVLLTGWADSGTSAEHAAADSIATKPVTTETLQAAIDAGLRASARNIPGPVDDAAGGPPAGSRPIST